MTPAQSDEVHDAASVYRRRKRAWLFAIAAAGFIGGVCEAFFAVRRHHNPLNAPLLALYAFLIFGWYHTDSDQRGFRRGFVMNFLIMMLAAVGIPVYMFRTRGFAHGLIGVGWALLMLLAFISTATLGAIAVLLAMRASV